MIIRRKVVGGIVSKLFRAYRLYNKLLIPIELKVSNMFQSSFELTGYITKQTGIDILKIAIVSKLFRAYRLYNLSR